MVRSKIRTNRDAPGPWSVLLLCLVGVNLAGCKAPKAPRTGPAVWGYRIVRTYPHRPQAFTQGLVFDCGFLYEGTGLYGESSLCKLRLETAEVLQRATLPEHLWGEGITILGDRIFQLTWQSHIGFIYDKGTFNPIGKFNYPTEGWGLTHDGRRLILSDGTATLYFLDPNTLQTLGTVDVRDDQGPVKNLNELEFIKGQVYANIWKTEQIAIIDPGTGHVAARLDLTGLRAEQSPDAEVLNGIAYDLQTDRLFVTGKLWSALYEIRVTTDSGHYE